jgi:hypothetical protein
MATIHAVEETALSAIVDCIAPFVAMFVTFLQPEIVSHLCFSASRGLDRLCVGMIIRLDSIF